MDDETRRAFGRSETAQETIRKELDELTSAVTRLVRELDDDDKYREKVEQRDAREADEVRERLFKEIADLRQRIENIGASMRDLPEALLRTIEKKIYELRVARYEALQAGVSNEAPPLLPAPMRRDPTGRIRVGDESGQFQRIDEPQTRLQPIEPDDGDVLTPQQQRGIKRWVGRNWHWFLGGGGVLAFLKSLYDAIKHSIGH